MHRHVFVMDVVCASKTCTVDSRHLEVQGIL